MFVWQLSSFRQYKRKLSEIYEVLDNLRSHVSRSFSVPPTNTLGDYVTCIDLQYNSTLVLFSTS